MSCYFVIDTYIDPDKGRREYDEYIELVKPIVEAHSGEYVVRSEKIIPLNEARNPQRIISSGSLRRKNCLIAFLRRNTGTYRKSGSAVLTQEL